MVWNTQTERAVELDHYMKMQEEIVAMGKEQGSGIIGYFFQ